MGFIGEGFNEEDFNPYSYKFEGMSDEEFNEGFDSVEEADMHRELYDLLSDAESLFCQIAEVVEVYEKQYGANEKTKKYRKSIRAIQKKIEELTYV